MKKVLLLLFFACLTLFSGVVLSSCGEDTSSKTIVVSDVSGLTDVQIRDIGKNKDNYIRGANGQFTVAYHSDLKVEIYASQYGVDFSDLVVVANGETKEIFDTNRIDDKKYNPVAGKGSLYYGYITLPHIEKNTTIKIMNVNRISSIFTFEGENIEETQDFLKHTNINLDSNTEEYVNLYEFLTDESQQKSVARQYDDTLDAQANTYRTFKIKFDGVDPFEFNGRTPFKVKDGEGFLNGASMIHVGNTFLLDLGASDIGDKELYTIVVDFSDCSMKNFDVVLPIENQTYSVEASAQSVDLTTVADLSFVVNKTMEEEIDGIVADYSEMKLVANGTELVFDEEKSAYKLPENILTPLDTQLGDIQFNIGVQGIKYLKEEEVVEPIRLDCILSNQLAEKEDLNLKLQIVNEQKKDLPFGLDDDGKVIAFEGQKYVISWEILYDDQTYHTKIDPFDINFMLQDSEDVIFNIKNLLPSDNSDLGDDNTFSQLVEQYTLRAIYNVDTSIFDKFEIEFTCVLDNENLFMLDVKPYKKNVDLLLGFEDEELSYETAIYKGQGIVADWRSLTNDLPLTREVEYGDIIAIKITGEKDATINLYDYHFENEKAAQFAEYEDISTDTQTIIIIKFRVGDTFVTENEQLTLLNAYAPKE